MDLHVYIFDFNSAMLMRYKCNVQDTAKTQCNKPSQSNFVYA